MRFLADDGVTYSRPGERPAAWRLDPVPLVVDAASWREVEVGLAQRAELLNAVLVDLYGERTLLRDGILPAAAVLAHPGFTRIMAYASRDDPRPLVTTATDLGRDAAGAWRVIGDRAQAPSGSRLRAGEPQGAEPGAARALPRGRPAPDGAVPLGVPLRAPPVGTRRAARPAGGRTDAGHATRRRPTTRRRSRPTSASRWSRAATSTVRDGWVLMKSLGRLERVDVILRRVDAAWSDPLELRGDSQLGVAGLAEAVRREPGARRQRARRRGPREPGAARLRPGGLRAPARRVAPAADRADLVVRRPRRPRPRARPPRRPRGPRDRRRTGPSLDTRPEILRRRILAAPHRFVAQERLPLSQAPTWSRRPRRRRRRRPGR